MIKHLTYLSLVTALAMTACSTTQVPVPYKNAAPYTNKAATQTSASYQTRTYSQAPQYGATPASFNAVSCPAGTTSQPNGTCLLSEGPAVQQAITQPETYTQPASYQTQTYGQASQYDATPASFSGVSCPSGTTAQPNGTCLLGEAPVAAQAGTYTQQASTYDAAQAAIERQYVTAPRTVNAAATPIFQSNVRSASAAITEPTHYQPEITRHQGASLYLVKPGDTVYSLARRHCVSVSDIQGTNSLDQSYGIKIGQQLQLPPNHC
ncbi:LysM peptidoglycan-binding domain-containing protein [Hellea sp.]|nr:LysM peptidoglycan-binding domain-containing protein [Hellea sp.]